MRSVVPPPSEAIVLPLSVLRKSLRLGAMDFGFEKLMSPKLTGHHLCNIIPVSM